MPCSRTSSEMMAFQSIGGPVPYRQIAELAIDKAIYSPPTVSAMVKTTTTERTAFGERLHKARLHAGLSQPDLAAKAGIAQSTLSILEKRGQGSAHTATLARLTGVRVDWLEKGHGPMLDTSEVPGQARQLASEKVAHHLVGTPAGTDYRTIALSLAAALEESGTELTVQQFIKLLEATYNKLKP